MVSIKLPPCKELLALCDRYPRPTVYGSDIRIRPLSVPSSRVYEASPVKQFDSRTAHVQQNFNIPYPSPTTPRKRRDTIDREELRKAKLESDPWSDKTRLTPKSVFCLGCKRDIRLDRRNDYYPGLWLKHRALCQGIAKMKASLMEEGIRARN